MPYKDKEKQKESVKLAVQRHRGITKGITLEGITEGITYPPIVYALVIKRKKLQDICKALEHRNLQSRLYFGCGDFSISFDSIEDLLEATRGKNA